MNIFKFELGVEVMDRITGFVGTTTGRVQYITGCCQYLCAPKVGKDGVLKDSHWFDEDRLDITGKKIEHVKQKNGFGISAPVK